jgi:tetratricopeptide (TPR) repeat protein
LASVGWRFGAFELDIRHRQVTRGAEILKIADGDIDILRLLVKRAADNPDDPVVPYQTFFDIIWPGLVVYDKTLTQCINRLRQIFGADVVPLSDDGRYALGCAAEPLSTAEELEAELLTYKLFHAFDLAQTAEEKAWDDEYVPSLGQVRWLWTWASAQPGRKYIAIRLAASSARVWIRASKVDEGAEMLDRAVALLDASVQLIDEARLLWGAATVFRDLDRPLSLQYATRAVAAYRHLSGQTRDRSHRRSIGEILTIIGENQVFLGEFVEADRSLLEAGAILSEKEFSGQVPKALFNVNVACGLAELMRHRLDAAAQYFKAAEDVATTLEDPLRQGLVLLNRAEIEYARGDLARAIALNRRSSKLMLEASAPITFILRPLVNTSTFKALSKDVEGTRRSLEIVLSLARHERGYWLHLCLQAVAYVISHGGQHADAARLLGFVDKAFATSGAARQAPEQALYNDLIIFLADKQNLDRHGLDARQREGAELTEAQAVELAIKKFAGG